MTEIRSAIATVRNQIKLEVFIMAILFSNHKVKKINNTTKNPYLPSTRPTLHLACLFIYQFTFPAYSVHISKFGTVGIHPFLHISVKRVSLHIHHLFSVDLPE